mgnify:CR=1 FL=1
MKKMMLRMLGFSSGVIIFACAPVQTKLASSKIQARVVEDLVSSCHYEKKAVPAGVTLMREMFEKKMVTYGETCMSEIQTGICTDGSMIWNGSFANTTCVSEDFSLWSLVSLIIERTLW